MTEMEEGETNEEECADAPATGNEKEIDTVDSDDL